MTHIEDVIVCAVDEWRRVRGCQVGAIRLGPGDWQAFKAYACASRDDIQPAPDHVSVRSVATVRAAWLGATSDVIEDAAVPDGVPAIDCARHGADCPPGQMWSVGVLQ